MGLATNTLDKQAILGGYDETCVTFRRLVVTGEPAPEERWDTLDQPGTAVHMVFGYLITRTLLPLVKVVGLLPRRARSPFATALDLCAGVIPRHQLPGFSGGWRAGRPESHAVTAGLDELLTARFLEAFAGQ